MKESITYSNSIPKLLISIGLILVGASVYFSSHANPQGGTVVHGSATINPVSATRLDINQTSDKAIINWQSFSIQSNEHTHFQQPSSTAAVLNRVTGGDASNIFGRLTSNGQVMLINPRGIWFGPGSVIDVGGLIASTNNITNQNFIEGRYKFDPIPDNEFFGSVVNDGTITVKDRGLVALMAPGVANNGVIQANLGSVVLGSGNAFTLDFYGDDLINFSVDKKISKQAIGPNGQPLKNGADNAGVIQAPGGQVIISARAASNVVENVINIDGVVEAKAAYEKGGKIYLVGDLENGTVRVNGRVATTGAKSGARGGDIRISGNKIKLTNNARVDASGFAGGGTIKIGGDQRGLGPFPNAKETILEPGAMVTADALVTGDGGEIIVFAEDYLQMHGALSVRGNPVDGLGGFVETSSANVDYYEGSAIDTGFKGELLIDPTDLTVTPGQAAIITGVLVAGGIVTLDTNIAGPPGLGIINFNNSVFGSGGGTIGTLNLIANFAVQFNASVGAPLANSFNINIFSPINVIALGSAIDALSFNVQGPLTVLGFGTSILTQNFTTVTGLTTLDTNGLNVAFTSAQNNFIGGITGGATPPALLQINTSGAVPGNIGPITGLPDVDFIGPARLTGGAYTANEISFLNTVEIIGDSTFTSNVGQINFEGGFNSGGLSNVDLIFNPAVQVSWGASFGTEITGFESITVNGPLVTAIPTVTTTGPQVYNGTVLLSSVTPITATGSTITYNSTLDGFLGTSHIINGDAVFNGDVINITDLTVNGNTTAANTNIDISNIAQFNGNFSTTLAAVATIVPNNIFNITGTTTGVAGSDLVVSGAGGTTTFGGAVSGYDTITTNSPVVFNGGSVSTSGMQTYNSTVTTNSDLVMTGSNILANNFTGNNNSLVVNGAFDLVNNVASPFTTVNNFTVNGDTSLDLDAATTLATTGTQLYNGNLDLLDSTNLQGTVQVNGTVFGNANPLDITGNFTLPDGANLTDVTDLSVSGLTTLDNTTVSTTNNQDFNAVNISNIVTFNGNDVNFNDVVNGAGTLIATVTGQLLFTNNVSLGAVAVNGQATVMSAIVSTVGNQIYNGDLSQTSSQFFADQFSVIDNIDANNSQIDISVTDAIILGDSAADSLTNGSVVNFFGETNVNFGSLDASSSINFFGLGILRSVTNFNTPDTNFSGTNINALNNPINTSGDLSLGIAQPTNVENFSALNIGGNINVGNAVFNTPVAFAIASPLNIISSLIVNAPSYTINNNMFGGGSLTVNGNTTINTNVTDAIGPLQVNGNTVLNASTVATSGSQTYNGDFTLTGPASVITNSGNATFSGIVNGGQNLTIAAGSGNIAFNAPGVNQLGFVTVNSVGSFNVNNGGTLDVTGFTQVAGSGSTNVGFTTLDAGSGPVSITTLGDITGSIIGGPVFLSSGAGIINVAIDAASLTLFGTQGGTLTGIVNGQSLPQFLAGNPFFSPNALLAPGSSGVFFLNTFPIGFVLPPITFVDPYVNDENTDMSQYIDDGGDPYAYDEYQREFMDIFGEEDIECI